MIPNMGRIWQMTPEILRNGIDLSWILLDEEWGCLQRNLRGKKAPFLLAFLRKREAGRQITG